MIFDQLSGGDWVSSLVWFIFFMVFFMFYPRMMLSQIMWKLEGSAKRFEEMTIKTKSFLASEIMKNPDKRVKDSVDRFLEFFAIEPVGIDPYGIVSRLDHLITHSNQRFTYFVDQIAKGADSERKANIRMGLAGGIELNMVSKVVRHYIETVKKTKSYQIALILQMQLPMIERLADALYEGTRTLAKGQPVGDSIGPMLAADLIGSASAKEIEEEIVMAEAVVHGRRCFVLKAKGPGGRIGYPGEAVRSILRKNRVSKIITVDAAAKLEGEKTGSVAEGVGVAMGGPGVERSYIEEESMKANVPIDSIIVKMSSEEAIKPMRKAIKDALPKVMEAIGRSMETVPKNGKVVIVGVGNTSGVGDSAKSSAEAKKWVDRNEKKMKEQKKKDDSL